MPTADEDDGEGLDAFLERLIEHVPAMVFVKEATRLRFVRFNAAGEELLGRTREELIGKSDYDFFPNEQADFFVAKDREVLASGEVLDIPEEPIDTPHGRRWLHTRKIPMLGDDGRPRYLVGISMDVTEHKGSVDALEAQLVQAQKMEAVGRLAAGVAHDFNNLLSVILSYAELAMRATPSGSAERGYLEQILDAGAGAAALTQQLLAFSRQQVMEPRAVDLDETVREVVPMLKPLLREDIEVVVHPSDEPATVHADPGKLAQVLLNLGSNARDAMPAGGRLLLETRVEEVAPDAVEELSEGRYVVLSVTDTGTGMEPETLTRAFEPFFTTKGRHEGTGLGLATVYGIVRQSAGAIRARTALGAGTTMEIFLPWREAREADASSPVPDAKLVQAEAGLARVLLVEDDSRVRELAAQVLAEAGYEVVRAEPREALAAVRREGPFDLLLTDVVMPGISGRELAERVLAMHPGTRLLFMSGYTEDRILRLGLERGELPFLAKPFTPDSLRRRVREVLDAPPRSGLGPTPPRPS